MARTQDENGVWWTDQRCPTCGEAGPNQQAQEGNVHLFMCSECSNLYSD